MRSDQNVVQAEVRSAFMLSKPMKSKIDPSFRELAEWRVLIVGETMRSNSAVQPSVYPLAAKLGKI